MNYSKSSWAKSTPPSQKNKTKQGGHILHVELNFPDICIDTDMKTPLPLKRVDLGPMKHKKKSYQNWTDCLFLPALNILIFILEIKYV